MCNTCKLREENADQYKLNMEWLGHAQAEEMHARYAVSNTSLNDGTSGYHLEMKGYHKCQRLKLEQQMRAQKS